MAWTRHQGVGVVSWRSYLFAAAGYVVAAVVGAMLIVPVGPGSGRIAYVCLLAYSLMVAIACRGFLRWLTFALAILFFAGAAAETIARREFGERLRSKHLQDAAGGLMDEPLIDEP